MVLPLTVSEKAEKSGLPKIAAISGVRMLATNEVTTAPKAPPITTATAKSITLPRKRNFLKPANMSVTPFGFDNVTRIGCRLEIQSSQGYSYSVLGPRYSGWDCQGTDLSVRQERPTSRPKNWAHPSRTGPGEMYGKIRFQDQAAFVAAVLQTGSTDTMSKTRSSLVSCSSSRRYLLGFSRRTRMPVRRAHFSNPTSAPSPLASTASTPVRSTTSWCELCFSPACNSIVLGSP